MLCCLQMYGFSIATALQGIKLDLQLPPDSQLIAQPPADDGLGKACMFHYTWGTIFKDGLRDGPEVWHFDKRDYTDKALEEKVGLSSLHSCAAVQRSRPVAANLHSGGTACLNHTASAGAQMGVGCSAASLFCVCRAASLSASAIGAQTLRPCLCLYRCLSYLSCLSSRRAGCFKMASLCNQTCTVS